MSGCCLHTHPAVSLVTSRQPQYVVLCHWQCVHMASSGKQITCISSVLTLESGSCVHTSIAWCYCSDTDHWGLHNFSQLKSLCERRVYIYTHNGLLCNLCQDAVQPSTYYVLKFRHARPCACHLVHHTEVSCSRCTCCTSCKVLCKMSCRNVLFINL